MLNRQLSSSSSKSKNEKNKTKKKKSPRSPLRDLNGIDCGRSTCSSSSSSMSVDVSRGCLRFLLPTSSSASKKTPLGRSKPRKTAPKSAPNGKSSNPSFSFRSNKPPKENVPKPIPEKEKKVTKTPHNVYQMQNGKKEPSSKTAQEPMVDESGESPQILQLPDSSIFVENSTPVGKLQCGSGLVHVFDDNLVEEDSKTNTAMNITKTPPVQASVSPEIQCGPPSMLVSAAATPACYGAGHLVSGVTDRRKCRAKGILTVGETDSNCVKANIFGNSDDVEISSKPRASLVPLPAEASMHWLLSPCDKEQKSDLENGVHRLRKSFGSNTLQCLSSPSSGHRIPFKGLENSSSTSASSSRRTRITLLSQSVSPAYNGTPTCEALMSREKRKHRYDLAGEDSPFSVDSLGIGNVIQTPESDLSSDRHVRSSWLNSHSPRNHDLRSGVDSLEKVLSRVSLSPKTQMSVWDSPGLNFHISDFISPTNSVDLTQFSKAWDNRASSTSDSSLGDMSQYHMRISWREGLVSRIFEMDEFDCCRCLSDDENDVIECSDGKFKCSPYHELNVNVGSAAGSSSVVGHEPKSDGEPKEKFPEQRSNPCAESISTDGGGLFASADSDWTLCYKNHLFEL